MTRKNRLQARKDKHEELLKREAATKARLEKKKAKKEGKPAKKRKIPKGLVRGASRDPAKYEEAVLVVKARRKAARTAPKKMDLGAGPTGTEKRLGEQKARGKEARAALVAGRRQMDTTR